MILQSVQSQFSKSFAIRDASILVPLQHQLTPISSFWFKKNKKYYFWFRTIRTTSSCVKLKCSSCPQVRTYSFQYTSTTLAKSHELSLPNFWFNTTGNAEGLAYTFECSSPLPTKSYEEQWRVPRQPINKDGFVNAYFLSLYLSF